MADIAGLLYSQIGYNTGWPKRMVVRTTRKSAVPDSAVCEIGRTGDQACLLSTSLEYWGELWQSHWWVADFSQLDSSGTFEVSARAGERLLFPPVEVEVGPDLLWERTWRTVAIEQMDRRIIFAKDRKGWCDCGSTLREVNSHAVMINGLCDLMEHAPQALSSTDNADIERHIAHGCEYLAMCQDLAAEKGLGDGAIVHEHTHQHLVIPGDVAKCAVALARAARLLSAAMPDRSVDMLKRASAAYDWLRGAKPLGNDGFSAWTHGAPDDYSVPAEFMTRDELTMAWAAWELCRAGLERYREQAIDRLDRVMGRQVPQGRAEDGLYGHFYSFDSSSFTEKAWEHHAVGHDCGATYPHYLIPMIDMYRAMPDRPRAGEWRDCLERFAYGYFVPACNSNPFLLLPQGVFGDEGLLVFAGLWHGSNGAYAHAAALALEFEKLFGGAEFREIATGNLQWIAGLNAGVTRESLAASHVWSDTIPEGIAEPRSMIYGIGRRHAGSWRTIRGSICNGFDIDQQFRFETRPSRAADGPFMFTDEDWIVHTGAWLSALGRMDHGAVRP